MTLATDRFSSSWPSWPEHHPNCALCWFVSVAWNHFARMRPFKRVMSWLSAPKWPNGKRIKRSEEQEGGEEQDNGEEGKKWRTAAFCWLTVWCLTLSKHTHTFWKHLFVCDHVFSKSQILIWNVFYCLFSHNPLPFFYLIWFRFVSISHLNARLDSLFSSSSFFTMQVWGTVLHWFLLNVLNFDLFLITSLSWLSPCLLLFF